jgi:hypothetical protein
MSDKPIRKISAQEIEAARSPKGGWTKATLAAWGVAWPPRAGWKERLIAGEPLPQPGVDEVAATSSRPSACLEAKLLHQVVMAVINAGQSDLLKGIDELNSYYGSPLPTVAEVIGGRPKHAIITGDISFDDKVYSFKCARTIKSKKPKP